MRRSLSFLDLNLMKNLSVNIIGAGAVGHLWACFLKRNGCDVSIYTRTPRESQRVNVNSPTGDFSCDIDYLTLEQWKEAAVTLVCIKAFQLTELCQILAKYKASESPIILIMNGMGLVEIASRALPNTAILQASFVQGALLNGTLNGITLTHTGNGTTYIGDVLGLDVDLRLEGNNKIHSIITYLDHALPTVHWNNEHQQTMMLKLFINAIINPVTALKNINNGEIIVDGKLDKLAQALLQELSPLISELLPSYTYKEVQQKIINVAESTANNRSSMLRDVEKGKQTEIDFINGHIIKLAEERSIKLSEHCKIVQTIHQLRFS
jgi:2-dehydropantoate 2-reductase